VGKFMLCRIFNCLI